MSPLARHYEGSDYFAHLTRLDNSRATGASRNRALDSVLGAEPNVECARVGALSQIYPPLERNPVDDDAGVSEGKTAADERRRDRAHISSSL